MATTYSLLLPLVVAGPADQSLVHTGKVLGVLAIAERGAACGASLAISRDPSQ